MAKETKEAKKVLERVYTIPLRKEWLKAPRYKRAKKAVRALKEFLAKHMKVENRELDKIKIDNWVNRALWLRGIKKPAHKITVRAIKDSDGVVKVEFVGLPKKFKAEDAKLRKKLEKAKKLEEEKAEEREKRKKEEEKAKAEKQKKEAEKSEEEKLEEKEKKEKEKMLRKEIAKEQPKPMATQQHRERQEMKRMVLDK